VTGATNRTFAGPGSAVADVLLPHGLVGAVAVDVFATTRPCELAIPGGAALHAADPLRRPGARGRGEPAVALGASLARDHAQSVAGAAEGAAFPAVMAPTGTRGGSPKRRRRRAQTAARWITKAP
jgi:hypothetical protein